MLALLVLVAAVGVERVMRAREARVIDAPAASIRAADGSLLAAVELGGPARLQWVDPLTLRSASRPLRLREDHVSDYALSPDGARLAVGSESRNRIDVLDLRRWRSLGSVRLPGANGQGGASGLVWAGDRRLLALAGSPYGRVAPVVVDAQRRRVVARSSWRGRPIRWQRAGGRLVLLASERAGAHSPRARLLSFDARGRIRELALSRIEAGSWRTGPRRWRTVEPGLAVSGAGDRAYVVATHGQLVADVDLRSWRLVYHDVSEERSVGQRIAELVEPPAHAKEPIDSAVRTARMLPGGVIAVTGEDQDATADAHQPKTVPYGVRLIDPARWTWRTVDRDAQDVTVAGGSLLARRWACDGCVNGLPSIGLRVYDTAGELRFSRFAGARTIVHGAADRYAYIGVTEGRTRRLHVIDLDAGDTVRQLPMRQLRLLNADP
jgi:hypothetical protein